MHFCFQMMFGLSRFAADSVFFLNKKEAIIVCYAFLILQCFISSGKASVSNRPQLAVSNPNATRYCIALLDRILIFLDNTFLYQASCYYFVLLPTILFLLINFLPYYSRILHGNTEGRNDMFFFVMNKNT